MRLEEGRGVDREQITKGGTVKKTDNESQSERSDFYDCLPIRLDCNLGGK